jgi:hypothetical protein
MKVYKTCLNTISIYHAFWYVVPADNKENAPLIVSQIVLDAFNELKMAYPKIHAKHQRGFKSICKLLAKLCLNNGILFDELCQGVF